MVRRVLYKVGDTVKISREEPLYHDGKRMDGKKGKLLKKGGSRYTVKLVDGRTVTVARGFLASPSWYNKLSSKEMKKIK